MSEAKVATSLGDPPVAARDRPATQQARHGRVGRLLRVMAEVGLLAAIALAGLFGAGIVGNPWYRILTIDGGSMEPAISRGDLIVVAPAPSKVEPGMVLVMTIDNEVVTHRVVAVNADGTLVTRGDANRVTDAWASQEVKVAGLYVATIPLLGHVLPVIHASEASFADGASAAMHITVGSWPTPEAPPTPDECAGTTFDQVLVGTPGDDVIDAGNGGALVFGLGGNDTLSGGNAKDCLVGGDGNDILVGGNGKDVLLGGDGNDTLHGGGDGDVIEGGNGKDRIDGGNGTDTCYGTSKDVFNDCETVIGAGASPTPTPAPTPTPTPEPTPDAAVTPGVTPAPEVTPTPESAGDPAATPTPTPPESTVSPGPAVTPEPAPEPTPEPTPTPAATPTPEPTPTPAATPTPEPTPTPAATAAPEPTPTPSP